MKKFLGLLVCLVLLAGCGTLFNGTDANMKVTASPDRATVVIKSQSGQVFYNGPAPTEVRLPKKETYTVEISLAGYKTQTVAITQSVTGWFWGNFCFGDVIGMVIDFVTGGMWDLHPTEIDARLTVAMTNGASGPAVVFYTRDDEGQLRYVIVPLLRA